MVNVRFSWISSRNSPVFRYLKDFCKCRYYSGPCNEPGFVITTAAAAKSLQSCLTLCDPIDGSHQAPPSLGFSRQEHWSGLPFPSPVQESEK